MEKGRKRKRDENFWERNITKKARNEVNLFLRILILFSGKIVWRFLSIVGNVEDLRGKHAHRKVELTPEMQRLIREHCNSIPHRESQYRRENTALFYFTNPELILCKLYELFCQYYVHVTGDKENQLLNEHTYRQYFNRNIPFTFRLPRSDVCNICYKSEMKGDEGEEVKRHKSAAKSYFELKQCLLENKEGNLCLEFDYGQNLPLPKVPVNAQFFCRLLWFYIFNIHVHTNKNSYMIYFLEGLFKKGANTVCSFFYHAIKQEFKPESHKKIILFSDATPAQNKNYTVFSFLPLLASTLHVEIMHIFPVRGHSFCQCDRNFAIYYQSKRRAEMIETASKYVRLIDKCRNPPFQMVDGSRDDIIQDYDLTLKGKLKKPKGFLISKASVIVCTPDGEVKVFEDYKMQDFTSYSIKPNVDSLKDIPRQRPLAVGVAKLKIKDVMSLMNYLTEKGKQFFTSYFALFNTTEVPEESDGDENDEV